MIYQSKKQKQYYIYILVLLSGLNVDYKILLGDSGTLGMIITYFIYLIRVAVCLYSLCIFIKGKLCSTSIKYILYFVCIFTLNTLSELRGTGGGYSAWIHRTLSMIYLFLYYMCIMRIANEAREEFLKAMYYLSVFLLLDSLALYFLQPEIATYCERIGVYTLKGVAGNRNHVIEYWILGTIGLFGSENLYRKKINVLLWIITIFIQLLTKSGTGIIVMAVTVFMLLVLKYGKRYFKLILELSYGVVITIYIVMVLNQKLLFEKIIVGVLHKSPTLTGRFILWKDNLKYVWSSLLIGYGYDGSIGTGAIDDSIIYLLVVGGILGLVAWLFMLISSHISVLAKKNLKRSEAVFCIGIFTYIVRGITESVVSYPHIVFWCLLILLDTSSQYKKDKIGVIRKNAIESNKKYI